MLQLYDINYNKIAGLTNYKDLKVERELSGDEVLSFSYPQADSKCSYIKEECYIRTKNNEYVIKETTIDDDWTEFVAKVNVEDLKGTPFGHFETVAQSCTNTVNLALAGTGWTIGSCNVTKVRTVRKANCSSWDILEEIRKVFLCDFKFDAINKKIYIYQSLGSDKGSYFTEELNLRKLTVQGSAYDYCTRIIPIGKDGLKITSINNGKNYVENYQYSNKIITVYWEDNRYEVAENLKEDAEAKLAELSKPIRAYSVEVTDLASVSNTYKNILDYDLGDTITLLSKDKKVKEKQRIVKLIEYPDNPERNSCEIANRTLRFEDIQADTMQAAETLRRVVTTDGKIDNFKVDFDPIRLEVNTLIAQKADIGELNAAIAKIGTLEATTAKITELEAVNAKIDNLVVDTAHIADASITNAKIAIASIDTANIIDAAITNAKIGFAAIDTANIKIGAITNALIGAAAIDTANIKNGIITNALIADSTITNAKIANSTITNAEIANATITGAKIGTATITTANIATGTITSANIQDATIVNGDIANATITGAKIANATINTANIADAAITSAKIADANITSAKIATASITTALIDDAAITNAKIGLLAVDTANIADAAITNAKIGLLAVTSANIADATITSAKIASATITAANIANATITSANIAIGTITSANIHDATIVNGDIANATITGAKIANATIATANIVDAAITTAKIADANITSSKIANATITTALIADASITNAKIGLLAVATGNIADAAITNAKIGLLAVTTANIVDASISTAKIADAAITSVKITDASITNAKIASLAVATGNIQDAAITNAKIGLLAVTSANIVDATIGTAKIADTAITTAKIADANITTAKIASANITTALIADAAITNAKIGLLAVTAANISDATITSGKIASATITAANIANATITAAQIANATITGAKIASATISSANIVDATITGADIANATITSANIGNATITGANIASATIGTANIASGAIGTAQIATGAITTALISNAAIGTTQIADGSITDAKIVGLTANKITAGTIDASVISVINLKANNITAGALTIDGDNLIHNTGWVDSTNNWVLGAGWSLDIATKFDTSNTLMISRTGLDANTRVDAISEYFSTTQVGGKFVATIYVYSPDITLIDGNSPLLEMTFYTASGTLTGDYSTSCKPTASGVWQRFTLVGTAGSSVAKVGIRCDFYRNGTLYIARPMLQRGSIASEWKPHTDELISAGAITSTQIAAGTITTANIGSGQITNTLIAANTITGDKLVVDSITAREIATGAITANEIAANTITGAKIAAGTITAANIAAGAITTSQLASNVGSSLDISSNTSITSRVTTNTYNQGISDAKEIALATELGKMLYLDPTFKNGNNGIGVYNNAGGGTVTHARISSPTGCPTTSGYCLQITTTGTASPGLGGFCFATASRANAIFIVKILANIPVGSNINFASNSYGTGGSQKWLTSQAGTGNWEEYICKVTCGSAGTFSSTNFFYINTGTLPFTWYVAYATVFDMTDVDGKTNSAEIISTINQSAESIGISASRIAITGSVTLSSWSHVSDVTKIDGGDIYTNSITATQIAAGTITAASGIIADAAITNAKIANSAITAAKIADATITSAEIASGTITAANIASATITNAQIATGTITSANILDGTISNAEIANATITGAKIASATITTGNIATANITTALIADGSITNAKIASLSVDAAKITDATITASKIVNATITGAKIASATITSANIASATITAANIQDAAITTAKIQDASITDAKITSLNASKIIAASITVDKLASNVGSSLDISANNSITLKADKSYVDNPRTAVKMNGIELLNLEYKANKLTSIKPFEVGNYTIVSANEIGGNENEQNYIKTTSAQFLYTPYILSETNSTQYFSLDVYNVTTNDGVIYVQCCYYDANKVAVATNEAAVNLIANMSNSAADTWNTFEGYIDPLGSTDVRQKAVYMRIRVLTRYPGKVGTTYLRNLTWKQLKPQSIVNKSSVISAINLSPEVIQIQANKIQISGSVTLSDWTYSGLTTINGAKVQTGTITADKLTANTITADSGIIADAAITTAKIDNLSIDSTKIADAAIDTAKIKDAAITNAKIKDADITTAKIKDASITTAKIIDGSITNAKIVDASITNAKILSLDATKITTGYLDADRIAAGTITADKFQVGSGSISSSNLCLGKSFSSPTAYMNVTTITVASNVGDRSLTVASTSSMVIGTTIRIGTEVFTITDINSLVITLSSTLTVAYANGTSVYYQNLLYANDGVNSVGSGYTVFGAGSMNNNAAEGAYLQVDLGAVYRIAESRLFFYGSDTRYYYYKIKYSEDGNNWCYAVGNPNVTGWNVSAPSSSGYPKHNPTIDKFAVQITARYLRVYGNGNSVNNGNHIYEWELYSTGQTIINGGQIKTGTITAAQIAADTITAASGILADASITTANIADGTITSAKIANATITGADIANATITNTNIANATIRTAQIASAAIITALIDDGAITTAKIADATITTAKIADASITSAKIISLDANKINAGTITGALIKTSNTSDYIHMQNQSLTFCKGTSQRMFLGFDAGNNAAIELGILTAASTPHIDFHSGTGGSDYDSRIEAFNGYSTTGRGDLAVIAKNFYFYPDGRTGTVHLVVNSPNIGKLNMIAGTDKYVEVYAGTVVYGITAWVSDAKFKKNIYDTDVNALDKVMSIKHRKFDWKENNKHIELGYVAQELQQVDKGFVFGVKQENGSETLNPNANTLIPYLSKAIQELKVLVDKQADEIKKLKAKIK